MENKDARTCASPRDKLILLVDDDANIRTLLEVCLTAEGFRLVTAVNGLDALDKLEQKTPDLIVADLMMPRQGGFEFMRALPGAGAGRLPVFVVTGMALDASTIAMMKEEANVVEFFQKPVNLTFFIAALHQHLNTAPSSSGARGLNDRP